MSILSRLHLPCRGRSLAGTLAIGLGVGVSTAALAAEVVQPGTAAGMGYAVPVGGVVAGGGATYLASRMFGLVDRALALLDRWTTLAEGAWTAWRSGDLRVPTVRVDHVLVSDDDDDRSGRAA